MQAELDQLELERLALFDRGRRPNDIELPVAENLEVIQVQVTGPLSRLEEESPSRRCFDRGESLAAVAGENREDSGVNADAERLRSGALRDRAQLPLDLERERGVRDDESVSPADGTAIAEDLPRTLGDVLARHLDEPER